MARSTRCATMRPERARRLLFLGCALLPSCAEQHAAAPPPQTPATAQQVSAATPVAPPTAANDAPAAPVETAEPDKLARGDGTPADRALAEGDALLEKGELASARAAYERAQKLAPKDPAPRAGLARVTLASDDVPSDYGAGLNDARLLRLLKDLDDARVLDPNYGPVELERGRTLLVLGRATEALAALRRAAELLPRQAEAQSALGVALIATGAVGDAVTYLTRASRLDPNTSERFTNLGTVLLLVQRQAEARAAFARAVELN